MTNNKHAQEILDKLGFDESVIPEDLIVRLKNLGLDENRPTETVDQLENLVNHRAYMGLIIMKYAKFGEHSRTLKILRDYRIAIDHFGYTKEKLDIMITNDIQSAISKQETNFEISPEEE